MTSLCHDQDTIICHQRRLKALYSFNSCTKKLKIFEDTFESIQKILPRQNFDTRKVVVETSRWMYLIKTRMQPLLLGDFGDISTQPPTFALTLWPSG